MTKEELLDELDEYIRFGFQPEKNKLHKKYNDSESDEHFVLWLVDELI
jgi:hypothetical protein